MAFQDNELSPFSIFDVSHEEESGVEDRDKTVGAALKSKTEITNADDCSSNHSDVSIPQVLLNVLNYNSTSKSPNAKSD